MTVELLTEHHLEFLSLKGGCNGLSESTLVKLPHCWKSHVAAQMSWHGRLSCNNVDVTVFVVALEIVLSYRHPLAMTFRLRILIVLDIMDLT